MIDLESIVKSRAQEEVTAMAEIHDDLRANLPVSQARLVTDVLPPIRDENRRYEKFLPVQARLAEPGEVIVSITADGVETTNTAGEGDYAVQNLTEAREEYLVGAKKFKDRYSLIEAIDEPWSKYLPKGEVLAIEITRRITDKLGVGDDFYIVAPWKSEQLAREGDMEI